MCMDVSPNEVLLTEPTASQESRKDLRPASRGGPHTAHLGWPVIPVISLTLVFGLIFQTLPLLGIIDPQVVSLPNFPNLKIKCVSILSIVLASVETAITFTLSHPFQIETMHVFSSEPKWKTGAAPKQARPGQACELPAERACANSLFVHRWFGLIGFGDSVWVLICVNEFSTYFSTLK